MSDPGAPLPEEAPPPPAAGSGLALPVSVGVVVSAWAASVVLNVAGTGRVEEMTLTVPGLAKAAAISGLVAVAATVLLLVWSGERLADLGFRRAGLLRQIGSGTWLGALIFIANTFALAPLIRALIPAGAPEGIDLMGLFDDYRDLWIWIPLVLIKGGFVEELWRIFALTRFEKLSGRPGLIAALAAGSIVFGTGHLYQGLAAGIGTGFVGLAFALVYLRRRNALEAVSAHAIFDLIGVTLGYVLARTPGGMP